MQSIFSMNEEDRSWYTINRLYPQNNPKGYWGCASVLGFLSKGEDLLECCEKDKKTLDNRKISYSTIAQRIIKILNIAAKNPDILVEKKFKVTFGEKTLCYQFCPFSPKGVDDEPSPFKGVQGGCEIVGNRDISIENTITNRSIKFSNLLPHLIESHHFFEGNVPYRLPPEEVIEVLEIEPDVNNT